jgi:c-di-GMP-binding flagellar brake protein YcgR
MDNDIFSVGLPLYLQVIKMKYGERYPTTLVGWEKDSFFIARVPYSGGKPLQVSKNDGCIVRFMKEGEVYGFQTEVLSYQFYPVPLVFFKYPQNIEFIEIRKSKRYKANIPLKLMHLKSKKSREARIVDLSETGCMVKSDSSAADTYEFGDTFYITFNVMDKTLELDCGLRNFRSEDKERSLGMEFLNMTPEKGEVIRSIIEILKTAA